MSAVMASYESPTSGYTVPDDLPTTHNRWMAIAGDLALYNTDLYAVATALFQHTFVFGILFLFRGFSPKRALDLHYLTIAFALSLVALPLVFIFDRRIDEIKLLFFLEHEAIEYLIAIRILAPAKFVANRSGLILLSAWCSLVLLTIPVILDDHFHHAADIVAWSAFVSDFLLGISGAILVYRWAFGYPPTRFTKRKIRAEALAGVGFMLHGFVTMCVGPVFALVLYHNLDPAYFAYVFVAVFLSAFFAVALMMPVAALFFSNIWWCFGHRRAVFPGQAEWYEEVEQNGDEKDRRVVEQEDYFAAHNFAVPQYGVVAPSFVAYGTTQREETRSPSEAWKFRLPEERATGWKTVERPSVEVVTEQR